MRVVNHTDAVARSMLSGSGWNIAAVFATTGKNAKKSSAAAHTAGRSGAVVRASSRRSTAVANTKKTFRY